MKYFMPRGLEFKTNLSFQKRENISLSKFVGSILSLNLSGVREQSSFQTKVFQTVISFLHSLSCFDSGFKVDKDLTF